MRTDVGSFFYIQCFIGKEAHIRRFLPDRMTFIVEYD